MKQNVLITGGAGFIGSHLVREILKYDNLNPVVLDDLSGGFLENIPVGVDFIKGSINDTELLKKLFEEYSFQYVYHLAAYAAEGLSHFIRIFNYENNLIGSINLINQSVIHKIKCFVFTSSIAVYGKGQIPMIETMTPMPEDPYGIAKYAVELDLANAKHMFGLNYVVFRPHNVYGEYQNIGDKYRNVVGIFMNQILQGKPMSIFGNGSQQRAFSYVGDITSVIASCAWNTKTYGEVFNVGADIPYTVKDLAHEVMDVMDQAGHPINYTEERNEVKIAYSDHQKVRTYFGDTQQTSLKEGLTRMAEWVKKTGVRRSKNFDNVEIMENLPSAWLKD